MQNFSKFQHKKLTGVQLITCGSCGPFSGGLFTFLLRRLLEECQQRGRIDVATVVPALKRKQVFAIVLLQRKAGTTRRTKP